MTTLELYTNSKICKAAILTLVYIIMVIGFITAIPYAIIKGLFNMDYYEDWFDIILKRKNFHKK